MVNVFYKAANSMTPEYIQELVDVNETLISDIHNTVT